MELDDMKLAWQALDQRLQAQQTLQLDLLRESRLDRVRGALGRLQSGQFVQLAAGVLATVALGRYTLQHVDATHVVVYAVVLMAYTVLVAALAIRDIAAIASVDFGRPVLEIQHRLAEVRRARLRSGVGFAIAGCIVWLPLTLLVFQLFGADLWRHSPNVVAWLAGNGAVCLALVGGVLWLARRPDGPRWARFLRDTPLDRSLREVDALVDELERFRRA